MFLSEVAKKKDSMQVKKRRRQVRRTEGRTVIKDVDMRKGGGVNKDGVQRRTDILRLTLELRRPERMCECNTYHVTQLRNSPQPRKHSVLRHIDMQ